MITTFETISNDDLDAVTGGILDALAKGGLTSMLSGPLLGGQGGLFPSSPSGGGIFGGVGGGSGPSGNSKMDIMSPDFAKGLMAF